MDIPLSILATRQEFIVIVVCDFPPIPDRQFDFAAYDDNGDGGTYGPVGNGKTRAEALESWLDSEEENRY